MTGSPALADEPEDAAVKEPSGQLTEIIASALGLAAKAARTQWPDDTDEIQAITDAMVRLLPGVPLRSDGQLTIKSLAEQAGLKHNKLTHKHTGLKDLFYVLVRAQNIHPKDTERLQQERDELAEALKRPATAQRATREGQATRPHHPRPGSGERQPQEHIRRHRRRSSGAATALSAAAPTALRPRLPQTVFRSCGDAELLAVRWTNSWTVGSRRQGARAALNSFT